MISMKKFRRTALSITASASLMLGLIAPGTAEAFTADSPSGVDVSKWQHPGGVALDWNKVAASGQKFAFIKATDGIEGKSAYFAQDSKAAADAGLIIGSYHKAHPDISATKQAAEYVAALQERPAGAKTLPPVLDIELDKGLTPTQLETWTKEFLQAVELGTGQKPMVYTYRSFWKHQMGNTTAFTNYPLWLAAYQDNAPTDIPGGWDSLTFWQRSSTSRVNGIPTNVDVNVFNGTDAELQQFIGGGAQTGNSSAPKESGDAGSASNAGSAEAENNAATRANTAASTTNNTATATNY